MSRRRGLLDVPAVERRPWGILGLVLNIVPSFGIGTITIGIHTRQWQSILVGVVQFLLTFAAIGFIWSVAWGIAIFLRSRPAIPTQTARGSRRTA